MIDQAVTNDLNIVQIPILLVCSRKISSGAKSLFGYLKYWQRFDADYELPKQMIADDLHRSPATVDRQLRELQLAGYLIMHLRPGCASIYRVVDTPVEMQKRLQWQVEQPQVVRASKSSQTYTQRFGKRLRQRDGNTCAYCGIDLLTRAQVHKIIQGLDTAACREVYGMMTTVDHVTPRSMGGTDRLDNLVLCCMKCNVEKGASKR